MASSSAEGKEVLINGQLYDVSTFSKRHPGGSVLNFYTGNGIDASQAFNNFHLRSPKALKVLSSIPHREANMKSFEIQRLPGQTALLKDFDELQKQLTAEGFFNPSIVHLGYRILEIVLLHLLGGYLLFTSKIAFGVLILGIAQVTPAQCTTSLNSRDFYMYLKQPFHNT